MAYTLDLTASLAVNYVETNYNRPKEGAWIFVLAGGAFYTKDLIVKNRFNGRELEPLTQYRALHTVSEAVLESGGKEVCAILVITDPNVMQISVKRRIVGGKYETIGSDLLNVVSEAKLSALDSTAWGQLVAKPEQFPAEIHTHYDKNVYGLETLIYVLDQIKSAITTGDKNLFGMFYQYIDRQFNSITTSNNQLIQQMQLEVDTLKNRSRFKPKEVVIFTDSSNPRDVFGYGVWRRLPDGLFMMTSNNAMLGKKKKIGEGPDYWGSYYAAWEYVSD